MPSFYPPVSGRSRNFNKSLQLYNNRLYYKYITDVLYGQSKPNYIDLWYDVPLYGKINMEGLLVMPRPELMTYSLAEGNLVTFDFFKTALEDYTFFLKRAVSQGRTKLNLLLNNFVVKQSFINSYSIQKKVTDDFTTIFNSDIFVRGKNITNFNSYFCELVDTIEIANINYSLFSAFSSADTNLLSTGLAFEFAIKDHDDDRTKNSYLQDDEFEKHVNIAANFGFRINKNAPWMIVADLASKPMLDGHMMARSGQKIKVPGYLANAYIPNVKTFFDKNYDRVSYKSFELFKESVINGYNKYLKNIDYYYDHGSPTLHVPKGYKNITGVNIIRQGQELIYIKQYDSKYYDDYYFLKKYQKVINFESDKRIRDGNYLTFKFAFDKMMKLKKPVNEILDEIEKFYTPTRIYNPQTQKLSWRSPKNRLTSKTNYVNIQTKEKPSPGKIVTEFLPDL